MLIEKLKQLVELDHINIHTTHTHTYPLDRYAKY